MTIGFDPHNLEVAVTAVINEAAGEEPAVYIDTRAKRRYDLTDRDEVRAYLMDRVRAHYARAEVHPDGVHIARIEEVVYRGIGYVFEPYLGDMHPADRRGGKRAQLSGDLLGQSHAVSGQRKRRNDAPGPSPGCFVETANAAD